MTHRVDVTLIFSLDVEGDVHPRTVGEQFCRLIETAGQIGCPEWMATPTAVAFIGAVPVDPGASAHAAIRARHVANAKAEHQRQLRKDDEGR